jgi:pimeloyl-ACP methyl ester carboxylesterase
MPSVSREGAEIWWESQGSGDPVLLVMGLGYPSTMWYRVAPLLARRHRVVVFDNRGVGRTGVPPGPYSIEQMADDAAAVLSAAVPAEAGTAGAAHVVGISLGGIVVQEMALRHPSLARSVTLLCTHPGGADAVLPDDEVLRMLTERGNMTPREAAEASVPFVYAADTDRALVAEDIAMRMRTPTAPEGYQRQLQAVVDYGGALARLGAIGVPTLVVHGTADRLVPVANASVIAGAVAGARLQLLEGAGHILPTDRTVELNALLIEFLSSVPPAPANRAPA